MVNPVPQSPMKPHFFQPLLPCFDSHLNIPTTFFAKHVQERDSAKLRSDASDTTWEVTIDDGRILNRGWKEFVTAHNLRIGDVVVFRQEGDLVFHVTTLGPSCCEVEYVQDNLRNLTMEENIKIEPECYFISQVTDSTLREDTLFLPRKLMSNGLSEGRNRKRPSGESSQGVSSAQNENRFVKLTATPDTLKHSRLYLPLRFTRVNKMESAGWKTINLMEKQGVEWPTNVRTKKGNGYSYMRLGSGSKKFRNASGV